MPAHFAERACEAWLTTRGLAGMRGTRAPGTVRRSPTLAALSTCAEALGRAGAVVAGLAAACLLAPLPAAADVAMKGGSGTCPPVLLQTLERHFAPTSLPATGNRREDDAPAADAGMPMLVARCMPWRAARGRTVAALFVDSGDPYAKLLWVALVGHSGTQVLASHARTLEINGATEIGSDSLDIDAAAWPLAPGRPGIALRTRTFRDRCTFDGGLDGRLTVFAIDGSALRPVFAFHTEHWRWQPGPRCQGSEPPRIAARVQAAMRPGRSPGPADLELTARRSDGRPPLRMRLPFAGQGYDLAAWEQAFSRWFDRARGVP